ncbi:unnamed protein product [Allacma fusca]|uniref:Uncharacterized protein n=1 Tax=Allacma fusca TaxID=39272 RepID=A0A8J2PTV1_9HEXA|nr:unnamed protein product [Allacma fusca]
MAAFQIAFVSFLIVGFASCAISPLFGAPSSDGTKDNSITTEPPWAPATQPREFGYNVMDGIQGANQIRQESWKNGTMSGMYAYPYGPNQWQVVEYIADERGFRVTSSKIVDESELMGGHHAANQTAEVDISSDGAKTSYKLKASDIGQKQKQEQQQKSQSKPHEE